ncbi:MAG: hypothetical protein HGB00_03765 [Chlorobiaceae bacterium]|nr:hypothetical protein [Chlorobiaceae bacterium]
MLKFILLLIALWLTVRMVMRIVRFSFVVRRARPETPSSSFSSSDGRERVQEVEYEVIESHIKKDE